MKRKKSVLFLKIIFAGILICLTMNHLPPALGATRSPAAIADFKATPRSGPPPLKVNFTDTSTGEFTGWLWDFGDGATSTLQNNTHIYASPGTYTVGLTVSSLIGTASLTKIHYITVEPEPHPPVANFTVSSRNIELGASVQFIDISTTMITAWLWDFGDGHTSTIKNSSHAYANPGHYTVSLQVTNEVGLQDTAVKPNYIRGQVPTINVNFAADRVFGMVPLTVYFSDGSTGFYLESWLWDFGDGTSSTGQNAQHTYNTSGTFTVGMTVTDKFGNSCTIAKTDYIRVCPSKSYYGLLQDSLNTPIVGARVELIRPAHFYWDTKTVNDGSFNFIFPDTGTVYTFRASKAGFIPKIFTSQDLEHAPGQILSLQSAEAAAYITGTITPGGIAEVSAIYEKDGIPQLAGKTYSEADGTFRFDFAENPGVSDFTLAAFVTGGPGRFGETSVSQALPVTNVNIAMNPVPSNRIDALFGGSSDSVTLAGYNVSLVQVPFGTIAADATVAFTPVANPDPMNMSVFGSGSTLYEITMDQTILGSIMVTLPFDLTEVIPGDFQNANFLIYKASSIDELLNGINIFTVPPSDIISVDYIGDGLTGLVTCRVSSLSGFGIGVPIWKDG